METRYNIALLEQVRDIIADENKHDQSLWMSISRSVLGGIKERWRDRFGTPFIEVSCPTAACVAGWAASLSGATMVVHEDELTYGTRGQIQAHDVLYKGEIRAISNFAKEQLGLTGSEADALFAAEWTNEEVLDNLDDILMAARHGQDWKIRWVEEERGEDGDYY